MYPYNIFAEKNEINGKKTNKMYIKRQLLKVSMTNPFIYCCCSEIENGII